jgi:MFS transporter, FSR family, fosmidomycin resistance protein
LTFLPSLFKAKEASIASIGGALSLLFVGGAAGKLVCGYLGARIGLLNTVLLTEGLTAIGIIALLPLPLAGGLAVMPLLGIGLWHVLGALRHGARTGGRACGIFYPGAIAASAAMPALIGLIGDGFGVTTATTIVAVTVLATVPRWALLMPMLPAPAGLTGAQYGPWAPPRPLTAILSQPIRTAMMTIAKMAIRRRRFDPRLR